MPPSRRIFLETSEGLAKAILEMHSQVGVAHPAANGLMYRGLMIRHLVMPNDVTGTKEILAWIASSLPKDTFGLTNLDIQGWHG